MKLAIPPAAPLLLTVLTLSAVVAAQPELRITDVPEFGAVGYLQGTASGVTPTDHRVAVYLYSGGWWTKPTFAEPLTPIEGDGTWACNVATGGQDVFATRFLAFLLPEGVAPPQAAGQAAAPEIGAAVARAEAEREPDLRTLEFADRFWNVKRSAAPVGPGPNWFSDDPSAVWVDGDGLHLTIGEREGHWWCTEVILNQSLGYGTYAFQTLGRVDTVDANVVVGLFTWDDTDPAFSHREIDLEFARWGNPDDPTNAQYVLQPWDAPGHLHRFRVELSDTEADLTTFITWSPGRIDYATYRGRFARAEPDPAALIESWVYDGDDVPPPGNENVRFNLWLNGGNPPTDGQAVEVVISDFAFGPWQPNGADVAWNLLR